MNVDLSDDNMFLTDHEMDGEVLQALGVVGFFDGI